MHQIAEVYQASWQLPEHERWGSKLLLPYSCHVINYGKLTLHTIQTYQPVVDGHATNSSHTSYKKALAVHQHKNIHNNVFKSACRRKIDIMRTHTYANCARAEQPIP